jgi:hypothetical protein
MLQSHSSFISRTRRGTIQFGVASSELDNPNQDNPNLAKVVANARLCSKALRRVIYINIYDLTRNILDLNLVSTYLMNLGKCSFSIGSSYSSDALA